MKAFVAENWCEPEELVYREENDPTVEDHQVLIEVYAAGVNFPDLLLIQGKYQLRPKRPFIPGAEVSGVVIRTGKSVTKYKEGDKVYAVSFLGGYAEKVSVPEKDVYPLPEGMSFEEGAGMVITYQSSYFGVVVRGKLLPNETLLVHAGGGGIGTSAIQIGKAVGAKVIATAGSEEKLEIAKKCGADIVLNYNDSQWSKKIRKEYGGADVVIDPVGGDIFEKSVLCLNFEGRIIVVGFTSGKIPEIAVNKLLLANASIVGLYWNLYQRDFPEKIEKCIQDLHKWYLEGKIKPVIYKTYSLQEAPIALRDVTGRKSYGKAILKIR
ncbi:MAG TPA: NADPH:quinone oxidoreductase family protein [Leptospiraceae bacterium]|nr:NADPH:quinone oxidoreductase family protein [Leptospiraceae bacterium]HMZ58685.1 NADPH:quinone oxidoreductase family protein [Leptospiraceae bacterium]HNF13792.1 NADPH:quinone oxidoreductase family protein [Leptospiraceae bacterium]HNF24688.1 NADPH:quinone oxidoreductase family protein [Leptospiraceae bacterium]HNH07297.1 NADPH:quinone oxidoreductase family protein [Leptospiraceae bacterium]